MRFLGKVTKVISAFLASVTIFSLGAQVSAADGGHAAILGVDASHKTVAPAKYNISYLPERGYYEIKRLRVDKSGYDPYYCIGRSPKELGVFNVCLCGTMEPIFRITHDSVNLSYYMESMQGSMTNKIIFSMGDAVATDMVIINGYEFERFPNIGFKICYDPEVRRLSYWVTDSSNQKIRVVNVSSIEEPDIINIILLLSATILAD